MNKTLFVIFISAIVIGTFFYLFFPKSQPQPTKKIESVAVTPTTLLLPSIDVSKTENWVPFTSELYHFSLRFPLDMRHQTTQDGERFYKLGPTQSTATELYDGIAIIIKTNTLGNETLQNYVKKRQIEIKKNSLQSKVSDIESIKTGKSHGFFFNVTSVGNARYIYLLKDKNECFEIIDSTVEPNNRPQLFKKIVDQILSTLKTN